MKIALLLMSSSIWSFPGLYKPLYWSKHELEELNKSQCKILKLDQQRLKELEKKRTEINWHLSDPYIGKLDCKESCKQNQKYNNQLTSNFRYDDFISKNGQKVKIVTIDNAAFGLNFSLKYLVETHTKSHHFHQNKDFLAITSSDWSSFVEFWSKYRTNFGMAHGFQTYNIIKQLAPTNNLEIITVSVFGEDGFANKERFLEALEYAKTLKPDILHLGLKFTEFNPKCKLDKKIELLLQKFPYIVAASGNDGCNTEAYPARCDCVTFDVGAYDKDHKICQFSQYEQGIGPKIVAPGYNIASKGLVPGKNYPMMIMDSGTSMAAALVTGFVATMLSEFGQNFTRNQLLKIIYRCTNQKWDKGSLLGAIDMRQCLFTSRVLQSLQYSLTEKEWNKKFEEYLEGILILQCFIENDLHEQKCEKIDFVKTIKSYAHDLDGFMQFFCNVLLAKGRLGILIDKCKRELLKDNKSFRFAMRRLRHLLSR